jgi:hypothetical protein
VRASSRSATGNSRARSVAVDCDRYRRQRCPRVIVCVNAAGLQRSLATTAMRRVSRSGRSPGGWDAQKPPSRPTFTTRLMVTKGLRTAPRANASLGASRAAYGGSLGRKVALGLSRAERTRHGVAAQRYARSQTALERTPALRARTGRGTSGAAPEWHVHAGSAACRLVSTEAWTDARAPRRYEARASRATAGVSARHTHPSASGRAEQRGGRH